MTMTELKPAARRFHERATSAGLEIEIRQMAETTRTAEDAASACDCSVGQIVKSLVFQGVETGAPYLLLISGTNRVDQKGVAAHIGEALTRPDAKFVRDVTGYAIGGIPPLGHDTLIKTYIDRDLLAYDTVWAAAGTPEAVFSVAPRRLTAAAGAISVAVN